MNLIDRYIIKHFLGTLFFAIFALCAIFLVVNLLETLEDFMDENVSFSIIVEYYLSYFPEILKILTPVAMLVATLFTVGRLSNLNEITSMKAGGLSLYRMMMPLIVLSLIFSCGQLYFNGWIVPVANSKKLMIEYEYLGKSKNSSSLYDLYFRDSPHQNVLISYYNPEQKIGSNISIETYSSNSSPRLLSRIESENIIWDTVASRWNVVDGIQRDFVNEEVIVSRFDTLATELNISHNQIIQLQRKVEEMNFDEFWEYLQFMKRGGKDIREQEIEYYANYAFPFANFIVMLFGIPFASIKKKGGIAVQIGAAMVISFTYLIFTKLSQPLGLNLGMSAIISGWFANIAFFIFGLIVLFRTRT